MTRGDKDCSSRLAAERPAVLRQGGWWGGVFVGLCSPEHVDHNRHHLQGQGRLIMTPLHSLVAGMDLLISALLFNQIKGN